MKVAVYWNLHKHCFSVQSREKENYGKVIAHKDSVAVALPKFVVRQAGRKKVLKEKSKNVHAFVVGYLLSDQESVVTESAGILITYNPYKNKGFVIADTKEQLEEALLVTLRINQNKPIIEAHL